MRTRFEETRVHPHTVLLHCQKCIMIQQKGASYRALVWWAGLNYAVFATHIHWSNAASEDTRCEHPTKYATAHAHSNTHSHHRRLSTRTEGLYTVTFRTLEHSLSPPIIDVHGELARTRPRALVHAHSSTNSSLDGVINGLKQRDCTKIAYEYSNTIHHKISPHTESLYIITLRALENSLSPRIIDVHREFAQNRLRALEHLLIPWIIELRGELALRSVV